MAKGPTWNDLQNATPADLKRVYKLDEKSLGVAVMKHSNDINTPQERREFYDSVYSSKRKS